SLYNSDENRYYYPEKARFNKRDNTFRLYYSNGSVARVSVEPHKKYFKLTLLSLSPRTGVHAIQWGAYHTNIINIMGEIIGVSRDTSAAVNYAIGMLALNDNTLGGNPETIAD